MKDVHHIELYSTDATTARDRCVAFVDMLACSVYGRHSGISYV